MAAQNGEGAGGEGGAEAVGDGVAGIEGLEGAGVQGAEGVVGAGGFAAEDVDIGAEGFGAEAGAAKKAAAADGGEDGVEIGDLFEEFLCGGSLASDDAVVVVGMDEDRAGFGLDTGTGFGARGHGGFGEGDFAAVAFDGAAFYGRSIFGHDDVGTDTAPGSGASYGRAMIAAGGSDDAVGGFGVSEGKDGVGGAANLKGASSLEVVAFEEKLGAGDGVEGVGSKDRSAMDAWGDTRVSFADGIPGGRLVAGRFDLWSRAHERPSAIENFG